MLSLSDLLGLRPSFVCFSSDSASQNNKFESFPHACTRYRQQNFHTSSFFITKVLTSSLSNLPTIPAIPHSGIPETTKRKGQTSTDLSPESRPVFFITKGRILLTFSTLPTNPTKPPSGIPETTRRRGQTQLNMADSASTITSPASASASPAHPPNDISRTTGLETEGLGSESQIQGRKSDKQKNPKLVIREKRVEDDHDSVSETESHEYSEREDHEDPHLDQCLKDLRVLSGWSMDAMDAMDELESDPSEERIRRYCKQLALKRGGLVWDAYNTHEGMEPPESIKEIIKAEGFEIDNVQYAGDSFLVALMAGLPDIAAAIVDPGNKLENYPVVVPDGMNPAEVLLFPAYRACILSRHLFEHYGTVFGVDAVGSAIYECLHPHEKTNVEIPRAVADLPAWRMHPMTVGKLADTSKCYGIASSKVVKVAQVTFQATSNRTEEATALIKDLFGGEAKGTLYRGLRMEHYPEVLGRSVRRWGAYGAGISVTPNLEVALSSTLPRPAVLLVYRNVDESGLDKATFNLGGESEEQLGLIVKAMQIRTPEAWLRVNRGVFEDVVEAPFVRNWGEVVEKGCKFHEEYREVVFRSAKGISRLKEGLEAVVFIHGAPVDG
ncbi:hypothetical protein BJ508DRAFT_381009 [Ascobolus immersus RN42]|uniref:Uncharacterized protein n=1 Tax=Ascobolus immersus RN42 TaxID=1160509 RepID=A0A3N4HLZ7_ASCIM|nr:hypothetical protein BJ508DRAFT_381009 [Ascobolus immersus RN42]